ncbi:MAG TPA: TetR/AcrR family transcriptional regulator [Chloroflexota bacterium]|nr:TetR/AcrR family transcriptional regulator [Chloroflexota bacterium]
MTVREMSRLDPPTLRRRRQRQEVLDAILLAARDVMRADGVAALSLHEVARRVGLRAPSLYEYVDGKHGLYDTLFLLGVRLFAQHVERASAELTPNSSTAEQLRARLIQYLTFAHEQPDLYSLVFERPVPGFEPSAANMAAATDLLAASRAAWAAMLSSGELQPDLTPDQSHDLFIALQHGLTAFHLANEPHLPVGQGRFGGLIEAAVALFITSWGNASLPPSGRDHP